MSKHVVALFESLPHCYHGGGGVTSYSLVLSLLRANCKVTVVALTEGNVNEAAQEDLDRLQKLGVVIHVFKAVKKIGSSRLRRIFPKNYDLLSGYSYNNQLIELLKNLKPDALLMYHWNALAAAYGCQLVPKIGLVGDPLHLPMLFRRELYRRTIIHLSLPKRAFLRLGDLLIKKIKQDRMVQLMNELLNDCKEAGAFAAHHAEDFRLGGAPNCKYYQTPVPAPSVERANPIKSNKFKILHIGHLEGVATLSGIEILVNEIIPYLEKSLPADSFEIHIVGGKFDAMPKLLQQSLRRPCVRIRGHIFPADEEFLNSHVILVPTPIELGIRVRIITALSFGAFIVAHEANRKGIPELLSGKNCILGNTGLSLAFACEQVFYDRKKIDEFGLEAFKTYQKNFSIDSVSNSLKALV